METNRQGLYLKALARRAEILHVVGELKRSRDDFNKILAQAPGDEQKQDALSGLCWAYSELGDYDLELTCADRLIRITRNKDPFSIGKALIKKAAALRDKNNFASSLKAAYRSIRFYRQALKDAKAGRGERRDIQNNISSAYNTAGMVYDLQGQNAPALASFKKALGIVRKINNRIAITQSLNNIGLIYWHMARYRLANEYFRKSLASAQKIGYKNAVPTILGNLGSVYNDIGKNNVALGYYREAIKISEETGNLKSTANNLNNVARYYGEIYDLDNALKYFTRSLNVNRKINYKYGTALGLNNIATIHFYKGEYGRALDCENEAETMGRNARMMEIILRCQILKARIFRVRKKYGASLKLFKNTIDLAESRKMEEIRRTALVHYVNTAIEEKNKKRLAAAAKYIPQLKMGLRFEPDDYFKCLSLVALIKYDIASRMVARAWKKLSILSGIVKKTGDRRFVSEIHMIRAQINIATGKEYRPDLKKAEALAKKINLMYLLDEIAAIRRGA